MTSEANARDAYESTLKSTRENLDRAEMKIKRTCHVIRECLDVQDVENVVDHYKNVEDIARRVARAEKILEDARRDFDLLKVQLFDVVQQG